VSVCNWIHRFILLAKKFTEGKESLRLLWMNFYQKKIGWKYYLWIAGEPVHRSTMEVF